MGFFDSLFNGGSSPDFSQLNSNVFFTPGNTPSFISNRPRLARGLDNALLSAATFQPGQTAGENISAVARNLMGLDANRSNINMQRQLAPYLAMHPLLQMQGEMQKQSLEGAQADEAQAHAAYYRAGGRELGQPKAYTDSQGKEWQILPDGSARPVTGQSSIQTAIPGMQLGDTTIPGSVVNAQGPLQQLSGRVPGLTNGTETERLLDRLGVTDPQQRWNMTVQMSGARSGAQTEGRVSNTPGFVPEAGRLQLDKNLAPIDEEMKQLGDLKGQIMWKIANKGGDPQARLAELKKQRQDMIDKTLGSSGQSAPSPGGGMMDLPQPVVSPVMNPSAITGVNTTLGGGATIGDLQNAMVPPGPRAARPPKPSPAKPAAKSRPQVKIGPDGTVSIG